jgi:DNA-directed RNA polymerase specialized sigma24 family protein
MARLSHPEDYADEAINRCARKISEGEPIRDVSTYCIGIARMLVLEMGREKGERSAPVGQSSGAIHPAGPNRARSGVRHGLPSALLDELPPENRTLILHYYQGDKDARSRP